MKYYMRRKMKIMENIKEYLNIGTIEGNIDIMTRSLAKRRAGDPPRTLNIVRLTDDPVVESYMKGKINACLEYGVNYLIHEPQDKAELLKLLDKLSEDKSQKILIQTPIDEERFGDIHSIMFFVDPVQDVDGFHFPMSKFVQYNTILDFMRDKNFSPTAKGVLSTMYAGRCQKGYQMTGQVSKKPVANNLRGETITIIGSGLTSGCPIAYACIALGATVYVANSTTCLLDLQAMVADSTIVVSCAGVPHTVNKAICSQRDNAIYINVGMSRENGKTVGDIDIEEIEELPNTLFVNPLFGSTGRFTCQYVVYNTLA
jgi:methylenetetrahydrofolate dehydrogenase (NADP+)/methenyltetrahydrofolate cyclohydrolase